jgi:hypothetical protein
MSDIEENYRTWEDPRWMGGDTVEINDTGLFVTQRQAIKIEIAQRAISGFEEKYSSNTWWTAEFVEEHPAIALTLSAVNDSRIFSHQALDYLTAIVKRESGLEPSEETTAEEVWMARLGFAAVAQHGPGETALLETMLTEADEQELYALVQGRRRVIVSPLKH